MKAKTTNQPKLETIHAFCQNTLAMLSKTYQMRLPKLEIGPQLKKYNASLTAMYVPEIHTILLNESWVSAASPAEVLLSLFHEFRHAYQAEAVGGRAKLDEGVDLATLKIWQHEIAHPVQPDPKKPDDPRYLNQTVEKDAVAFAKRSLDTFFSQGA